MEYLPDPLRTILAFILVLGVLVFVHELGHYLAARWKRVHVEAFSIGFGRPLVSWTDARGTDWKIGWIPLGGYVRLHGQGPIGEDVNGSNGYPGMVFSQKPVSDRAWIVAAGPLANFLLAAVVFAGLFAAVGKPVRDQAIISTVVASSPAELAGLLPGDKIVALDGGKVGHFREVQSYVRTREGTPIEVTVQRNGEEITSRIVPIRRVDPDGTVNGILGIAGGGVVYEPLNPAEAVWEGIRYTGEIAGQTLLSIGRMLTSGKGAEDMGGPVRIAQMSGEVAELGIVSLFGFIAILSINLGMFNLFPVPMLDGGHLCFYALEAIRGRPLTSRSMEIGARAGVALLLSLFIFVMWNDLSRLGVVRWAAGLIGG